MPGIPIVSAKICYVLVRLIILRILNTKIVKGVPMDLKSFFTRQCENAEYPAAVVFEIYMLTIPHLLACVWKSAQRFAGAIA